MSWMPTYLYYNIFKIASTQNIDKEKKEFRLIKYDQRAKYKANQILNRIINSF
jgi:hypothetical protein